MQCFRPVNVNPSISTSTPENVTGSPRNAGEGAGGIVPALDTRSAPTMALSAGQ